MISVCSGIWRKFLAAYRENVTKTHSPSIPRKSITCREIIAQVVSTYMQTTMTATSVVCFPVRTLKMTSSAPKRQRVENWTTDDKLALVQEIQVRKRVIMGSFTASITRQSKRAAWGEILNVLNSRNPLRKRTLKDVKKHWEHRKGHKHRCRRCTLPTDSSSSGRHRT